MYLKDKCVRLTIRVSATDYCNLCSLANRSGLSISEVIRKIITSFFIRKEIKNENN